MGLDVAKGFILAIMLIAIIGFVTVIALATLNNAGVLTAGSLEANQSESILLNTTAGVARFFQDATTWFILLSVVVIILIIAVVILAVQRFGGGRGGL